MVAVRLTKKAVEDKEELTDEQWQEIEAKIEEVSQGLSHRDLKLISNPQLDRPLWQLTINEQATNHRAYLDVKDSQIVVIAIWSSEFTHRGDKHWQQVEDRL